MKIVSVSKTDYRCNNRGNVGNYNKGLNNLADVAFKGISIPVTGIEKDFVDLPSAPGIALGDNGKTICSKPYVDNRPFLEFFEIHSPKVIEEHSLYTKNSIIIKGKDLERKPTEFHPAEKPRRGPNKFKINLPPLKHAYTSTLYTGDVYFCNMDEFYTDRMKKEHTLIVTDEERYLVSWKRLQEHYTDEKILNEYFADPKLKMQKLFGGIEDYCGRKVTALEKRQELLKDPKFLLKSIEEYRQKGKAAGDLLALVKDFDEALLNGDKRTIYECMKKIYTYYKKMPKLRLAGGMI